jgi:hypothetical protein
MLLEHTTPAWPLCPNPDPAAKATETYWRSTMLKSIEEFVKQCGLDPKELTQPPEQADETCRSYCPRCRAQFTTTEGVCADCGGLPLVAFSSPTNQPKGAAENSRSTLPAHRTEAPSQRG